MPAVAGQAACGLCGCILGDEYRGIAVGAEEEERKEGGMRTRETGEKSGRNLRLRP